MTRNKLVVNRFFSLFAIFSTYLLWLAAVFDPIGTFYGFRFLALGCCFLTIVAKTITANLSKKAYLIYLYLFMFFVLFIPGYGSLVAALRGGASSNFIDTSYIAAGVLFACSLIYFDSINIDTFIRAAIFALRALSITIIFALVTVLLNFSLKWIYFFVSNDVAFFSIREYGGIKFYYIYFIASPMIIFLLAIESWSFFNKPSIKSFALLLIPVLALFLSGTRANMLISLTGVFFIYLWRKYNIKSLIYLFFFIIFFLIILSMINFDVIKAVFDPDEGSNSIKIGYLVTYSKIFSDPITILFGQGFNAHVWSTQFATLISGGASKTELTYLEFIRVFGIFGFIYFISVLVFLISKVRKIPHIYGWIAPALLLYLAGASLNPYLFSSNGMLILGLSSVIISKTYQNINNSDFRSKTPKGIKNGYKCI